MQENPLNCLFPVSSFSLPPARKQAVLTANSWANEKNLKGSISGIEKFRTWPLCSLQGRYGGERKFLRVKEDWNHKRSMHLSCTFISISVNIYEWRRKRLKVYKWMALSEVWCGVIKDVTVVTVDAWSCEKWNQMYCRDSMWIYSGVLYQVYSEIEVASGRSRNVADSEERCAGGWLEHWYAACEKKERMWSVNEYRRRKQNKRKTGIKDLDECTKPINLWLSLQKWKIIRIW